MPKRGDVSHPTQSSGLLNEKRSAHATIRGYLYQTCLGVLRWLDLKPNEVLLCEGDEDLDRFLLDGSGVSEQVKAYTGRLGLGDRAVLESLTNFLLGYVTLSRQGQDRKFVFTTTAEPKRHRKSGLDFDLLERWRDGDRSPEVIVAVKALLQPVADDKQEQALKEAHTWLDGQPQGWVGFMDAVEWTFGAPKLAELQGTIRKRISEHEDTNFLPPDTFLDRLVVHVLDTSSQKERSKRILDSKALGALIDAARIDLQKWSSSDHATRIRALFEEADAIEPLLHDNTAPLPKKASPGKLLTAAYEVIPFDEEGRSEELAFLRAWCDGDDSQGVLLLTGEGGSGKTRLLIEWCRRLRRRAWHAGFLLPEDPDRPRNLGPLIQGVAPRLVVMDYAETRLREVGALLKEIASAPPEKAPKVRLVLLARRKGEWWANLSNLSRPVGDLLLDFGDVKPISPLISDAAEERRQAFERALTGFAQQLGIESPESIYRPDLSSHDFERALYLHMAALATLQGQRIESAADALRLTLDHERLFWRQQIADLKLDGTLGPLLFQALDLAVAAVTLTQGAGSEEHARAILDRVLKPLPLQPHHTDSVIRLLRNLYSGESRFIDPLQPDLLGEELVAENLRRDSSLLARLLRGGSPEEAYFALIVLLRLVRRLSTAEDWIKEFAKELENSGTPEIWIRLQGLCDEDEYQNSVPLREIAQRSTEESLRAFQVLTSDLSEEERGEYARLLNNYGNRLGELGRREDALQATQEAVQIRRQLAHDRPDAFNPVLASSLNNLGNRLSELGRREDALQATQEAVQIRRQLAHNRPDAFNPDLASSLNNLGIRLSELGRREDALQATQEAVRLYRQLAHDRPDAFNPDLALSLNNLGIRLSELGRREDALQAAQEAVLIFRQLAHDRPDAFNPVLAGSLASLSRIFSEFDQSHEAFKAIEEAVRIYSAFFLRLPAAFATWMGMMVRDYLRCAEAAGVEPDKELLAPITETLQALQDSRAEKSPEQAEP